MLFAAHLIETVLVGTFRSTSDVKYQSHLAYAIQELLRYCRFTRDLVVPSSSVSLKIRARWNALPKQVVETVTPLLESRFAIGGAIPPVTTIHPVYPTQTTYREWIQLWVAFLISRVQVSKAKTIFNAFRLVIRNREVGVAHQLLPHLVLNILISGTDEDTRRISEEIITVLRDQLDVQSQSSVDKRMLSAQVCISHLSINS